MRLIVKIAAVAASFLAAELACQPGAPAWAVSTFLFSAQPGEPSQTHLLVNGQPVLTVAGNQSAKMVQSLASQLALAADRGITSDEIQAVPTGDTLTLVAGPLLLVKVDAELAKAHRLTKWGVAGPWVKALRTVFGQPYLAVKGDQVVVPVGERRSVRVLGSAVGPIQAGGYDGGLIEVSPEQDGDERMFSVYGKAPGRTGLLFACGDLVLGLQVWAAEYAGVIDQPVIAEVTGHSIPKEVLREAARLSLIQAIHPRPGAQWRIGGMRLTGGAPPAGAVAQAVQTVLIEGPEYLPVKQEAMVTVKRDNLPPAKADLLLFSNNPEQLRAFGLWYSASLPAGRQTRLVYHHENRTGATGELVVEVANEANSPARIQVVQGTGRTSADSMWVGHVAARTFLRRQRHDIGYLLDLQPGQVLRPVIQQVRPGHCASGIAEYRVISGSDVSLRVRLAPSGSNTPLGTAEQYPRPPQPALWAFPEAERKIEATYTVGQRWAFISIGRRPAVGLLPQQRLLGNYGVVYDIRLTVDNPEQHEVDLELLLTAPSGVARGIFYINGKEVESPLIRPGEDAILHRTPLPAGRSRTFRVLTIPESGSFYPVILVARAVRKTPPPPMRPEPAQPVPPEQSAQKLP